MGLAKVAHLGPRQMPLEGWSIYRDGPFSKVVNVEEWSFWTFVPFRCVVPLEGYT